MLLFVYSSFVCAPAYCLLLIYSFFLSFMYRVLLEVVNEAEYDKLLTFRVFC